MSETTATTGSWSRNRKSLNPSIYLRGSTTGSGLLVGAIGSTTGSGLASGSGTTAGLGDGASGSTTGSGLASGSATGSGLDASGVFVGTGVMFSFGVGTGVDGGCGRGCAREKVTRRRRARVEIAEVIVEEVW